MLLHHAGPLSVSAGVIAVIVGLWLVSQKRGPDVDVPPACETTVAANGGKATEIWGIAAISTFLWESVLGGTTEVHGSSSLFGQLEFGKSTLKFRSGPAIAKGHAPAGATRLVLVLNGRVGYKVAEAVEWLNFVENLPGLLALSVVLLGSEDCDNSWILPRMKSRGGNIDQLFVVYDSADVDHREIHQWPLGTATYRGFPQSCSALNDLGRRRRYTFNFFGTLHGNVSSRLQLRSILDEEITSKYRGLTGFRDSWVESEPSDSLLQHVTALLNSDLTLCPGGMNVETYRIYEALICGSVPVILNDVPSGQCNGDLRLLRKHGLPAVFLNSWDELLPLLESEMSLSHEERVQRRQEVFMWYRQFLANMREEFLSFLP